MDDTVVSVFYCVVFQYVLKLMSSYLSITSQCSLEWLNIVIIRPVHFMGLGSSVMLTILVKIMCDILTADADYISDKYEKTAFFA